MLVYCQCSITSDWLVVMVFLNYSSTVLKVFIFQPSNKEYGKLRDASWTPRGKIVFTINNSNNVVVISEVGKVITTHTQMTFPRYFSVSNGDVIFLSDLETGVYQSTADGVSWSLVFKPTDG